MATRQLGRSIVLQSLYEWDFSKRKEDLSEIVERNLKEFAPGFDEPDFIWRLVTGVIKNIKELDAIKKRERVFDHLWSQEEQRTVLGLLKGRKEKKKKDLGIRNYPESCTESMLDDQVHGI